MAAGFEAEVVDEDELEGRKGAAAAAAAAAPSDQGAVDTGKAEALSAKQQASKLQSQLAKIQNIMQRKGQDHKDAFAMPPKVGGGLKLLPIVPCLLPMPFFGMLEHPRIKGFSWAQGLIGKGSDVQCCLSSSWTLALFSNHAFKTP
eukprot:scaffold19369_cov19-Tisochrysis_lutea.AAC.1